MRNIFLLLIFYMQINTELVDVSMVCGSSPILHYGTAGGVFMSSYVFLSSNATVNECLTRCVFGAPQSAQHCAALRSIQRGSDVFLYNFSTRLLHGGFRASDPAGLNLQPGAFRGAFPVQVCMLSPCSHATVCRLTTRNAWRNIRFR